MIFAGVIRAKAYLCCFTQFTVDQPKMTVNGSVLSDTPNVRYLVALYCVVIYVLCEALQCHAGKWQVRYFARND